MLEALFAGIGFFSALCITHMLWRQSMRIDQLERQNAAMHETSLEIFKAYATKRKECETCPWSTDEDE